MSDTKTIGSLICTAALLILPACSQPASNDSSAAKTTDTAPTSNTAQETATAGTDAAAAPAAKAAPAADSTDTLGGQQLASFTGDAASGEKVFIQCKTCHVVEAGQNRIGPSLHAIVGRQAGTISGFSYTAANKNSGITWTDAKLFQYLENPQRVVPGTKMAFAGIKDPQKRADVIAYLKTQS